MPLAIARPTAFDNMTPDYFGRIFSTAWQMSLKGKPLQVIAMTDIGFCAGEAFTNPKEWSGRALALAGDELTYEEMERIFKAKTGKEVPTTFRIPVRLMMMMVKELGIMFKWFYDQGYGADVAALRKVHPESKHFGAWLETESGFRKV
jgi:uncharacterized protein YbjT (DUF2867 family)